MQINIKYYAFRIVKRFQQGPGFLQLKAKQTTPFWNLSAHAKSIDSVVSFSLVDFPEL